jgi:hypothetical protein
MVYDEPMAKMQRPRDERIGILVGSVNIASEIVDHVPNRRRHEWTTDASTSGIPSCVLCRHAPSKPFPPEMVPGWWAFTNGAGKVEGLPSLEQRAAVATVTKGIYDFAYRGDSGATHGVYRVMAAEALQPPPLSESLMLHNVKVATMVTFAAVADALGPDAAAKMTSRLQDDVKPG